MASSGPPWRNDRRSPSHQARRRVARVILPRWAAYFLSGSGELSIGFSINAPIGRLEAEKHSLSGYEERVKPGFRRSQLVAAHTNGDKEFPL